ncbi:MAG: hypothetical protein LQ342_008541 [Letrouitia transgressa]|nr:MAG: hypothetical protein LQ342_008541 [Letrouitia transgressa]
MDIFMEFLGLEPVGEFWNYIGGVGGALLLHEVIVDTLEGLLVFGYMLRTGGTRRTLRFARRLIVGSYRAHVERGKRIVKDLAERKFRRILATRRLHPTRTIPNPAVEPSEPVKDIPFWWTISIILFVALVATITMIVLCIRFSRQANNRKGAASNISGRETGA